MDHEPKPIVDPRALALLETGRTQSPVSYDVELGFARQEALLASSVAAPAAASKALFAWSAGKIGVACACLAVSVGALIATSARPSVAERGAPAATVAVVEPLPAARGAVAVSEPGSAAADQIAPPPSASPPTFAVSPPRSVVVPQPQAGLRPSNLTQPSLEADRTQASVHGLTRQTSGRSKPTRAESQRVTASDTVPADKEQTEALASARAPEPPPPAPQAIDDVSPAPLPTKLAIEDAIDAEMRELARAERLLPNDPARALAEASASDARHRPGYLHLERRYVIGLALIRLGRIDEAKHEAARVLREAPQSPFAQRLVEALRTAGH